MSLRDLIELSRRYGANPDFVLGGGGNSSWKDSEILYVKASGASLGDIAAEGFVKLKLKEVRDILGREFSNNTSDREREVLAALMEARLEGQSLRPSVETILHALFPHNYVLHTHPALVNGVLCARQGKSAIDRLFGSEALWIPYTTPGYVLSKALGDRFAALGSKAPQIVFLQNHGVFVAADSISEIDSLYQKIFAAIGNECRTKPDFSEVEPSKNSGDFTRVLSATLPDNSVLYAMDWELASRIASRKDFAPINGAFTPDHIVYAGAKPLFIERTSEALHSSASLLALISDFREREGFAPRIIAAEGLGIYASAKNEKSASLALTLFRDAARIARYSESFGGPHHMDNEAVEFIKRWEVEQYRSSIASRS